MNAGHPRLPSAQEALWEVLQALRLHRDHLGAGGGYFDVGAQQQQSAPMDVSVEMAEERARSRRKWEEGEAAEERRVQGEVVDLLMEDLLWETARWLVGVSGAEWRDREEVN